jgi:hypothetical protein
MTERRRRSIKELDPPANDKPPRAPWGVGRIALFARLDAIVAELAAGWPMTAVYRRHMAALGISYSGFCKLVRRHAGDSRPGRRHPVGQHSDVSSAEANRPNAVAPSSSTPFTAMPQDGQLSHAADEQPRGTFRYSPIAKEGEVDQLFGSGFFAGKK